MLTQQMNHLQRASWLVMAALLVGCAAFTPAKSFDEKLAYAYGTHTAILHAAAAGVANGELSVPDAEQVLKLSDQCRAILDTAKLAAGTGDVTTAEGQLALAVNVLTELQNYLRARAKR